MAYYAHISNEQYTVADRARLEEARGATFGTGTIIFS